MGERHRIGFGELAIRGRDSHDASRLGMKTASLSQVHNATWNAGLIMARSEEAVCIAGRGDFTSFVAKRRPIAHLSR